MIDLEHAPLALAVLHRNFPLIFPFATKGYFFDKNSKYFAVRLL